MSNDKTISFRVSNGNGVEKTFTLSWWASILSIAAVSFSLFLGVARGAAAVGNAQIENWFQNKGMPKIELRMDEKINKLNTERELRLKQDVSALREQITRLEAIVDRIPNG